MMLTIETTAAWLRRLVLALSSRQWINSRGWTIPELIIGALITALVTVAGFRFYSNMHGAALSQTDVSELQHLSRNSVKDIRRSFRMAGFRLTAHPSWEVKGDTLAIYFSNTQPVDTIRYYLDEYTSGEYAELTDLPDSTRLYRLMKQINSATPAVFADCISECLMVPVDSISLALTITSHAHRKDPKYAPNNGYRRCTVGHTLTAQNS
jgi:hypothetical protein